MFYDIDCNSATTQATFTGFSSFESLFQGGFSYANAKLAQGDHYVVNCVNVQPVNPPSFNCGGLVSKQEFSQTNATLHIVG